MYAVVSIKGKQYKVEEGRQVAVDRIDAKEGSSVKVDQVLAVEVNGEHLFGEDAAKAKIKVKVAEHFKDDKVVVFKYKSKNRYRKTTGHKQKLTVLDIEDISVPGIEKPVKKVGKPKKAQVEKAEKPKKGKETKSKVKEEKTNIEKKEKKVQKPEEKTKETKAVAKKVDEKEVNKKDSKKTSEEDKK